MKPVFHIISFGKRPANLVKAIQAGKIGSTLSTLPTYISSNSVLFLHCKGFVWGTAVVVGEYEFSDSSIWVDKVYPHRFPIRVTRLLRTPVPLSDGKINVELKKRFGSGWAYSFIFAPKPLPSDVGEALFGKTTGTPSVPIDEFEAHLFKCC